MTTAQRLRMDALTVSRKALRRGDFGAAERAMKLAERYTKHDELVWEIEGRRLRTRRIIAARADRFEM